jgi:DNA-directed RNA polymerase specialized sigma24 family protein
MKKWTKQRDKELLELIESQVYTYGEIADILGRSNSAIRKRRFILNYPSPPKKTKLNYTQKKVLVQKYLDGTTVDKLTEEYDLHYHTVRAYIRAFTGRSLT